ncbi:MAG: TasA family protein [Oliverpabstia sp.]
MKNNRWKSAVIIGTMAVLAVSGGILAYFTDTEEKVNNFTVGSIEIELQEPAWESKPDTDQDGVPDEAENILPLQTITKDPRVKNTGNNDAYMFLTVEVPCRNVITVNDDGTKNAQAMTELYQYTADTSWYYLGKCPVNDEEGNQVAVKHLYAYADDKRACTTVSPEASTTPLFQSVTFVNLMEGQGLDNQPLEIDINAYAIQTTNLDEGTTDAMNIWKIITNQKDITDVFTK